MKYCFKEVGVFHRYGARYVVIVSLIAISFVNLAEATDTQINFVTTTNAKCKVAVPLLSNKATPTWSGGCDSSKFAVGAGQIKWNSEGNIEKTEDDHFEGNLVDGQMTGQGTFSWRGGASYVGQW